VRLRSVEVIPYALPFRQPYVTARGTLTRRQMVLLRLRTEEGFEGLGEAVPLSLRGGATIETAVRELEALAETAKLDPAGFEADAGAAALSEPARCAVTTALFDLHAKADGKAPAAPVRCNASLVTGRPAEVAEEALGWAAEGFGTFKLKVGAGEDVAQVEAVRGALGPEAKIRLDANAAWSLAEATEILAAIEPLGIELVEQPVATIAEAARLAATTSIPLAGDESIVTVADAEAALAAGAFQTTGIKLSKVGGIDAGAAIDAVLPAYVASALDGPVGIAAGRRLAARIDQGRPPSGRASLAHGLATQRLFAATIAAVECELRGDRLHESSEPGLGVVIDEDALSRHRL
jgi:o-succinylbenzoate synthase